MSGTNASIPLAFNPTQPPPDLGRAIDVAGGFQTLQANAQKMAGQNAMRAIFSNPQNLDASGMPTHNAINQIMAVDPGAGMALMENKQRLYGQQMTARLTQLKIGDQQQGMIRDVGTDAMGAYQKALDDGMSPDAARKAGQDVYTQGFERLKGSGMFAPDQVAALSPQFDPDRTRSNIDYFKQREADRKLDLQKRGQDIRKDELGSQPGRRQEQDVEAVADAAITAENQKRKAAGEPPLDLAGEAKARIEARNAAKPQNAYIISDDDANFAAGRVWAGDKGAAVGFGRSPANQGKIAHAIAEYARNNNKSPADLARVMAEYQGAISAERALGTRTANMEIAANEVKYMAPLALSASETVNRTQYPTLNGILLAAEKGTGDENVVRFGLAANSLIYTYSKFLNPTGIPTDADKAKATEILSTAWSKGQFRTAIDQIKKEIASGQQGVASTKEEVGQGISGQAPSGSGREPGWPPAKTEGVAPALPAAAAAKLKKGIVSTFTTPDGTQVWTLDDDGKPKRLK